MKNGQPIKLHKRVIVVSCSSRGVEMPHTVRFTTHKLWADRICYARNKTERGISSGYWWGQYFAPAQEVTP
jgi:hypothetical protein